jgi:hypothetical protein
MLNRRGLIAAASSAGAAWLSGYLWFLVASRGRSRSMLDDDTFATLCSGWQYSKMIGKACLAALPTMEPSKGSLTRMILGDVKAAGMDFLSASALAYAIRELSRDDFRCGRIVTVDGWMLSLTETRAYALAALLPQPGRNSTFV